VSINRTLCSQDVGKYLATSAASRAWRSDDR
jgi:hypothetical protein